VLYQFLELFSEACVAIDDSEFKPSTHEIGTTQAKMQRRLGQTDERISRYLAQLDSDDCLEETEDQDHAAQ